MIQNHFKSMVLAVWVHALTYTHTHMYTHTPSHMHALPHTWEWEWLHTCNAYPHIHTWSFISMHALLTLHLGQTKTLMFSTTPMIGSPTRWQKLISLRTSINEISWNIKQLKGWRVEHWTWDPKDQGSNPVRSTRIFLGVFQSQKCCLPNPCVYTHAQEWSRTHYKDPVVHVRVRWIAKARKDPACTEK